MVAMPGRSDGVGGPRPMGVGHGSAASSVTTAAPLPDLQLLISKAVGGTLSPHEARELSALLESPAHQDAFTPEQRQSLQAYARGREAPVRHTQELVGDLSRLSDVREVPERFLADLVLAREALMEHASLLRADKATRMFEFVVPYAKAVATMTADPALQAQVGEQLLAHAEKAGFKELVRQSDGADGLKVLKDLLGAASPQAIEHLAKELKFDAPVWPKDPIRQTEGRPPGTEAEHLQPVQQGKSGPPELLKPLPPVMQPPVPVHTQRVEDPSASEKDHGTHKRLGPMMLWNALHQLRDLGGEGQDSAKQREEMTQLAVVALGVLVLFAILVVVLVAL
jgi:hypothetical protein